MWNTSEREQMNMSFLLEYLKESNDFENLGINARIMLKWILMKCGISNCILTQDMEQWWLLQTCYSTLRFNKMQGIPEFLQKDFDA